MTSPIHKNIESSMLPEWVGDDKRGQLTSTTMKI